MTKFVKGLRRDKILLSRDIIFLSRDITIFVQDQYGNYIVQHILDYGSKEETEKIAQVFLYQSLDLINIYNHPQPLG